LRTTNQSEQNDEHPWFDFHVLPFVNFITRAAVSD
jgi:hypothetical protein